MKVTLYPRQLSQTGEVSNPYIADFIHALQSEGIEIENPAHKNPLFSLIPRGVSSDYYIFHWLENVPQYKWGVLQFFAALFLLFRIQLAGKRIVWFMHNKESHDKRQKRWKMILLDQIIRRSDIIITHAQMGVDILKKNYPNLKAKVYFLDHPTKNRISEEEPIEKKRDILVWGSISEYKQVPQFANYLHQKQLAMRTKIVGKCNSEELWKKLDRQNSDYLTIENRALSFDELDQEIRASHFVVIPYASESILSSGVLMDSLASGAKVIGPATGSFLDYENREDIGVYTFQNFDEIPDIVKKNKQKSNLSDYRNFLNEHSWSNFAHRLKLLLV